jgi:glutamate synthase domain-containing protein 2/glutamate synthase domain-containing protein 1/glutamate synthase domain-containing protein 3/NADPH-dependent glutamate synthase beta subunit-like oxidoreductase
MSGRLFLPFTSLISLLKKSLSSSTHNPSALYANLHRIQYLMTHLTRPTRNLSSSPLEKIIKDDATYATSHRYLSTSSHTSEIENATNQGMYFPEDNKDACGVSTYINLPDTDGNIEVSHRVVEQGLQSLIDMQARGTKGVGNKPDGCGLDVINTPFFEKKYPELSLKKGQYGILHIAFPKDVTQQKKAMDILSQECSRLNLQIVRERKTPTDSRALISSLQAHELDHYQFILINPPHATEPVYDDRLQRTLDNLFCRFDQRVHRQFETRPYMLSASTNSIVFKGLISEELLGDYFEDLQDPELTAQAVIQHSRFATNASPEGFKVHPFKIAMNGENNGDPLLRQFLENDPDVKETLQLESINLKGYSDTAVIDFFIRYLSTKGIADEEIIHILFNSRSPTHVNASQDFYQLLIGFPLEGPHHIIFSGHQKIYILKDALGLRPQVGLMNTSQFYSGSEFPSVYSSNDARLSIQAAKPYFIDLKTGQQGYCHLEKTNIIHHENTLSHIKTLSQIIHEEPLIDELSQAEIDARKQQAGWTKEFDQAEMQPLLSGKIAKISMGKNAPEEGFIVSKQSDWQSMMKAAFAQVTNPPIAFHQNRRNMSLEVILGGRITFDNLHAPLTQNRVRLPSPMINRSQMYELKTHLSTEMINLVCFDINDNAEGVKDTLDQLITQAITAVKQGKQLLVLNDLIQKTGYAPIPSLIVATAIHQALTKAGLRRHVSLTVQTADAIGSSKTAQLISLAGVDAINPYLADNDAYLRAIDNELINYMARIGVQSLQVYQGGFWNAAGYTAEFAALLGVNQSLTGSFGFEALTEVIRNHYLSPVIEGYGNLKTKYENTERPRSWRPNVVKPFIEASKNTDLTLSAALHQEAAKEADAITAKTSLRGSFTLKPPTRWTLTHRPPIGIIGAGAAGFLLAKKLNDNGFNVTVFEENVLPDYGQVDDGIAPDHPSVKNFRSTLDEIRRNENIHTYYGIHVGNPKASYQPSIPVDVLKNAFALLVDTTGASEEVKLNVKGENHPRVLTASRVMNAMNGKFSLYHANESGECIEKTPFLPSYNDSLGIFGMGNVAADIARLSPYKTIHLFARGTPDTCRITLPMLLELKEKGYQLYTDFNFESFQHETFPEETQKIVDFFASITPAKTARTMNSAKSIYFHFNTAINADIPEPFEEANHAIKVSLKKENSSYTQTFSHVVKAMGRKPSSELSSIPLKAGWATGEGGALPKARQSAYQLADEIISNFHQSLESSEKSSDYFKSPAELKQNITPWLSQAINKDTINQIDDYRKAGHPLITVADFERAKQYKKTSLDNSAIEQAALPVEKNALSRKRPEVKTGEICLISSDGTMTSASVASASPQQSLLQFMIKELGEPKAPSHACGGNGTCIECGVSVGDTALVKKLAENFIETTGLDEKSEAKLIKNDKKYRAASDSTVLSCAHPAKSFEGMVIEIPSKEGVYPHHTTGSTFKDTVNAQQQTSNKIEVSPSINTTNSQPDKSVSRTPQAQHVKLPRHPTIPSSSHKKALAFPHLIESWVNELSPLEKECLTHIWAGGISFGAISLEAHMEISRAFNTLRKALGTEKIGPYSNSGEGGEIPARFNSIWQSEIHQVASGRFGLNLPYLVYAKLLEIKIVQGAKPGDGGTMPAYKVSLNIANTRGTPEGIELQSPGPMTDLFSIEDLKALIHALRSVNPHAEIVVKLTATKGIGAVAAGVVKAGANIINISGVGAGTGAASSTAVNHVAMSVEEGLAEVHQTLIYEGLRESVKINASGGVKTAKDIFFLKALGANQVELGTSLLIQEGCIKADKCHESRLNDDPEGEIKGCPVGIATQSQKVIDSKFMGTAEGVAQYLVHLAKEEAKLLESYGFASSQHLVGRTDLLEYNPSYPVNTKPLLHQPKNIFVAYGALPPVMGSSDLENEVITRILQGERRLHIKIDPTIRSFGARMGYFSIIHADFAHALKEGVTLYIEGAAGDGFASFMPKGITCYLRDLPNNIGRSLAGANLHVENVVNNGALYGANDGELNTRFLGDHSLYRLSGASILTEEIGSHAMQFTTKGWITILGNDSHYPELLISNHKRPVQGRDNAIGDNLGAGMVGGKAILPKTLVEQHRHPFFSETLQQGEFLPLTDEDKQKLKVKIQAHHESVNREKIVSVLAKTLNTVLQTEEAEAFMDKSFVKFEPRAPKLSKK